MKPIALALLDRLGCAASAARLSEDDVLMDTCRPAPMTV